MINVEYIEGSQEVLYLIQPLWERLKDYHQNKSKCFADNHANKRFQDRINELTDNSKVGMKVNLVKDKDTGQYIGYCISTINKEMIGEIDSLYVEKEYPKQGIGSQLMERDLEWLDKNKVKSKIIAVGDGNENAIDFYNHYGFQVRKIILEQISNT
jgi:diamine N-acetyltransferase